MALTQEILTSLNELLQPTLFSDYCTNGLQVEGKKEVLKLACAVSASLNVIQEAVEWQADMLVVHHGLFWNRDPYDIIGSVRAKLKLLLAADMNLVAYHLPLDAHRQLGNNWKAAQDLGWQDLQPFPKKDKQPLGVQGRFSPTKRADFIETLKKYYGSTVDCAEGGPEEITSAALVSGGAHKMILDAAKEGVDCFITGTRDEPTWHQAFENNINFYAVGHSASEVIGVQTLGQLLANQYQLDYRFITEKNPF